MTQLQEVLLELEGSYLGNPYYVSGNAIYSALAGDLPAALRERLQVSAGVFVPGEYGSYPDAHSQDGGVPYLGTGLRPVERYADLFLFRDPAHRWLSDTRPRDAHNTHPLEEFGDRTGYSATRSFGLPAEHRNTKRSMSWYLHCYCHLDGAGDHPGFPLPEAAFEDLQLGGARNYGFGRVACAETRTVDLGALSYDRLEQADSYQLELVTPYVLATDHPDADSQSVPWWWRHEQPLRRRASKLARGDQVYHLEAVDHGQVVGYAGDDPIETAKNGLRRVGTHAKYGFGEFRLRPVGEDRVPERAVGAAKPHREASQ